MDGEKVKQASEKTAQEYYSELNHVGGINDEVGGVDPRADENLLRLSGGQ